jgi:8-oxo-dGTP pyrophosphatase MutT (NUDIX family)
MRVAAISVTLAAVISLGGSAVGATDNPDGIRAAGCLISTPGGFVMGINRLINRLQIPAGRHLSGETARETAARETREETGLSVSVHDPALTLDHGEVVIFHCTPITVNVDYRNLTPIDRVEISRAMVVNPITLTTPDGERITTRWRFPEMRWLLSSVFGSIAGPPAD